MEKSVDRKILSALSRDAMAISQEVLANVAYNAVSVLTVPTNANYAVFVVEATASTDFTDSNIVARVTLDGTDPVLGAAPPIVDANTVGFPVGHLDMFDVTKKANLDRFKILKGENAGTLYVHVYYYE